MPFQIKLRTLLDGSEINADVYGDGPKTYKIDLETFKDQLNVVGGKKGEKSNHFSFGETTTQ